MKRDRTKTYRIKRYWCSQNQRGAWFLNHGTLVLRWSEKRQQWVYLLGELSSLVSPDQGISWNKEQQKTFAKSPKDAWKIAEKEIKSLIRSYQKTVHQLQVGLLQVQEEKSSASPRRRNSTKKPRKVPTRKPSGRSSPSTP